MLIEAIMTVMMTMIITIMEVIVDGGEDDEMR